MLDVQAATVSYGKTVATRGVEFQVNEGEVVALVGANGAGKSSLLKAILSVGGSLQGRISFGGEDVTELSAERKVALGIALVPEGRHVFPTLTVLENLELGFNRGTRHDKPRRIEQMYALFPKLRERRQQAAGTLSGGEQQMLAIGRALMSAPRLLMLDEPTLGLAPLIVADVAALLSSLRAQGQSILLAEQNARMSLGVSNRAYVLAQGEVVQQGESAVLAASDHIRKAYLGL
ncbi:ABC transporter ATP-binding protein [Ramlibacter sp. WS9]|uniref:ABC transporter ATP-binding protein n=1 Tax=Ramlibacter sp. WS9 TaxID=1882741 RepID=UPI0018EE905C|nr:ABC transporter ATP-binding protein [Ramlibacter sp. WS9]